MTHPKGPTLSTCRVQCKNIAPFDVTELKVGKDCEGEWVLFPSGRREENEIFDMLPSSLFLSSQTIIYGQAGAIALLSLMEREGDLEMDLFWLVDSWELFIFLSSLSISFSFSLLPFYPQQQRLCVEIGPLECLDGEGDELTGEKGRTYGTK